MVFIKYFPEKFLQSKFISMNTEGSTESVSINGVSVSSRLCCLSKTRTFISTKCLRHKRGHNLATLK